MKRDENMNKNKILKGSIVMLVAAVMIFSTVAVTAEVETLDVILSEGFEGGELPAGWEIVNSPYGVPHWEITNVGMPGYVEPYDGDYMAYCGWYSGGLDSDEWLISPEMDLTGYTPGEVNVTVEFWINSVHINGDYTVQVVVLGDGIEDVIWDMADEGWEIYEYHQIFLGLEPYIGEDGIQVAWHRTADSAGNPVGVDAVEIFTGEYIPPPNPPNVKIGQVGGGGVLSAEIKYFEDETETPVPGTNGEIRVEWSIEVQGGFLGRISGETSGEIEELDVGEMELVPGPGVFGLGRVNTTVTIEAYYTDPNWDHIGNEVSRTVTGFVFLSRYLPYIF